MNVDLSFLCSSVMPKSELGFSAFGSKSTILQLSSSTFQHFRVSRGKWEKNSTRLECIITSSFIVIEIHPRDRIVTLNYAKRAAWRKTRREYSRIHRPINKVSTFLHILHPISILAQFMIREVYSNIVLCSHTNILWCKYRNVGNIARQAESSPENVESRPKKKIICAPKNSSYRTFAS